MSQFKLQTSGPEWDNFQAAVPPMPAHGQQMSQLYGRTNDVPWVDISSTVELMAFKLKPFRPVDAAPLRMSMNLKVHSSL